MTTGIKMADILKKILGTVALPGIMFIIVLAACLAHGIDYFGTWAMWKSIMSNLAISITCAMGIGLQFSAGRFDFSGGAIMLLSAILAGNVAKSHGNNAVLFFLLCVALCVALSVLVALVYIFGRLPISIATIGMALLYESITCLIYNGAGVNLVGNSSLKIFSSYPMVLLPAVLAILAYAFYSEVTIFGKQSRLLAMNQQAAVNIGISEEKNVIISYIFSGLIFGFATTIYASTGLHAASFSSLTTVGELFTNILPVFIALMLGAFCNSTIGIIMGSLTLTLMSFGLTTVISSDMGSAITSVLTGMFVLVTNLVSGQSANFMDKIRKAGKRSETAV